jgi:16S rRNA (cytidine1402-2'-O)-methyltransferase
MLYLIATPIGNLSDMTYRAIEVISSCDYLLCEDTRHSLILLNHYHLNKSLKSYHKFNESESEDLILKDLKAGKIVGLISDAGTPGISDPGSNLVQKCLLNGIKVISIPGPCAAIVALTSSGLNMETFQFVGFLPRKSNELRTNLQCLLQYPGTTICYESPQRLLKTLELIHSIAPERDVVVARELTKKFEEIRRGVASELIEYWQAHPLKGEIVLLISGQNIISNQDWSDLTPAQHVDFLEKNYGIERRDAIKMAAEQRGVPKRIIYNIINTL